mmetsp:Transcript_18309/g.55264  ORF Transcript_18309/g.55264 Transcript_18309/m.55264 type:complete len:276 (+) Transcript_18309:849-1676(+)
MPWQSTTCVRTPQGGESQARSATRTAATRSYVECHIVRVLDASHAPETRNPSRTSGPSSTSIASHANVERASTIYFHDPAGGRMYHQGAGLPRGLSPVQARNHSPRPAHASSSAGAARCPSRRLPAWRAPAWGRCSWCSWCSQGGAGRGARRAPRQLRCSVRRAHHVRRRPQPHPLPTVQHRHRSFRRQRRRAPYGAHAPWPHSEIRRSRRHRRAHPRGGAPAAMAWARPRPHGRPPHWGVRQRPREPARAQPHSVHDARATRRAKCGETPSLRP